jgi:hypothetical protein
MYKSPREVRVVTRKAGTSIALGGGGLALAVASGLSLLKLEPQWADLPTYSVYAGIALIAIGGVTCSVGCFWPRSRRSEDFRVRNASVDEIPCLIHFAQQHLGPVGLPTEQHVRDLFSANQKLFYTE